MISPVAMPWLDAKVSSSLKKATRIARKVLANSLIASACLASVSRTGVVGSSAASSIKSANSLPRSERCPTTIRDGCRLSCSALPSRRNSGENRMLSVLCASHMRSANPTGTVDLMTMVASGAMARTCSMTASTELVSKKFASGS